MVTVDRLLQILGERRRRYVLYHLERRDGPVSVDDLAETVARIESHGDRVTDEQRIRVGVSLRHAHIPTLETTEFVHYDSSADELQLTEKPLRFKTLLTVLKTLERRDPVSS